MTAARNGYWKIAAGMALFGALVMLGCVQVTEATYMIWRFPFAMAEGFGMVAVLFLVLSGIGENRRRQKP